MFLLVYQFDDVKTYLQPAILSVGIPCKHAITRDLMHVNNIPDKNAKTFGFP